MNAFVAVIFIVTFTPVSLQENWLTDSFQDFIDKQTKGVRKYFNEQKHRSEQIYNASYDRAMEVQNSVNNYVSEQQKKISTEMNSYVDKIKESGQKVANSFTYIPDVNYDSYMDNPDVHLTVPAIIARHGYQCESHTVVSQGYVLNIHRIPRSKAGKELPAKTIFLQHGLFASSADWVLNGPKKSLAFVLADAGYDVWMSNIRGNRYSREHAWLKTDTKEYWNFSWHDVALNDVPAIIDYIIKVKGEDTKITYVGHSMGTTILFAMLTLRPEYNTILTAGFALAPVVFFTNLKSPIKSLAPIASNVAYMEMLYGSHEFVPKNSALGKISGSCTGDNVDSAVCKNVLFYICGFNEKQFNKTLLPAITAHLGTGTSWKTAVHFSQEIVSGKFQQFDYGSENNLKVYGTDSPPDYDLSKITLPITLFWSQNDLLSSEEDVKLLYSKLPSSSEIYMVPDKEFNHLDYLYAIDCNLLLNNQVISSLNKAFESKSKGFVFNFNLGK